MPRTKFGKTVPVTKPYAIYKGYAGALGEVEYRVLKTYKSRDNEVKDQYARWFVAAKSDATYGSFDMGDTYAAEVLRSARLVEATPEWMEEYSDG